MGELGDIDALLAQIETSATILSEGRIESALGLELRARLPSIRVGEVVRVARRVGGPLEAEVVGFKGSLATLLPLGQLEGVGPGDRVRATGRGLEIRCSDALLGRVLDGLGRPADGLPEIEGERVSVSSPPPDPLERPRIERPLPTGIRAIDALCTLGQGQRIGVFSGSGVGKSTLLGQLARQTEADVFVCCLVGERGREVREFLEDALGEEGRRKGVVVAATSDAPPLLRLRSAEVATAIAEYFRDQGKRVLLLVDSLTRFARAGREVGLAAGEAPARRGYPPSVFASLPRLLERAGTNARGSITAIYTVLVEGGDLDEPIADEVRGIVDGHLILDRELAERGHFPAIDPLKSLSRVMPGITSGAHLQRSRRLRSILSSYESKRDLILLGAYRKGADPRIDDAISRIDSIEDFLRQSSDMQAEFSETLSSLEALVR